MTAPDPHPENERSENDFITAGQNLAAILEQVIRLGPVRRLHNAQHRALSGVHYQDRRFWDESLKHACENIYIKHQQ